MTSVKYLTIGLLAINIFAMLVFSILHIGGEQLLLSTSKAFLQENSRSASYRFDDPFVAQFLLEKLDIFEIVHQEDLPYANYSRSAGGFKINDDYCNQHRIHFIKHPEIVFEQKNFITNFWHYHKMRNTVLPEIGARDLHPEVYTRIGGSPEYKFDMKLDANIFYMQNLYFYSKQIGKQFSCLSQASNHIPGHDNMYRKDFAAQALIDYANSYKSRPQCFSYDSFFIKTFVLNQKDQCLEFFREFNSPKYQRMKRERNVVYFRKIGAGAHEGSGVFPVIQEEEKYIRHLYKNGSLCGDIKHNNLIQYNVHNPLLIHNRKFGFRMFLLIASTNPMIAYYHDGYLRLSIDQYNANSKDKRTFVTNIGVNLKDALKDDLFRGMNEEQINEYTCWFLEQFQDYLLERNMIQDPNWLNNYLRPQFKKVMIHLIRMSQSGFFKKSSVFELYGLDFVMDDKFGLWFIEANTMPLVNGFTKNSTKLMNRMLADTFEIIFGLLRSRMKRVVVYINMLTKEIRAGGNTLEIPNLEQRREEFRRLTQNKFENEFMPSPENTFQKILDENEVGVKRYSSLMKEECF